MRRGLSRHCNKSSGNFFSPIALFAGGVNGVWYDPSDSATLFSDTAGTTPSPTPGAGALSVVGKMLDKSGNGNHAISYNTTTALPELSARVNLLTYSEDFSNAIWTPTGVTVSTNTIVAPDGTTTADTITGDGAVSTHWLTQSNTALASGKTYSICAKAGTNNFIQLIFAGDANPWANFDLSAGSVGSTGTNVTATISSLGNGWYRCTISTPSSAASSIFVNLVNSASAPRNQSSALSTSVYLWGADLRPANIGTSVPAYQRIADQYTYDSSGFPRYLVFNGTASGMYTPANLNLSGTDKATVFAGVRKLDNTNALQLVELSTAVGSNVGAFSMPTNDIGAGRWATYLNGSTGIVSASAAGTTAPITTVNTSLYDIALSADEARLRINGTQVATSGASSAGTGNFGTYPLFIGSRNNTTLWFNGYIYSLIVVGAASTAAQITSTESWINVKEGTVY